VISAESEHREIVKKYAASIIRPKTKNRKKVARRLPPKIMASNVGFAFLNAQITDLEERCAATRNGTNNKRLGRTAGERRPRERASS
jgi:hypothetical protein